MAVTSESIDKAYGKADELMKATNGHLFMTILKTRCIHCGRSPKIKTKCGGWFQTYLHHLRHTLLDQES